LGNVIGTSFATAGFTYDANISPNNQSFTGAVLATILRQTPLTLTSISVGTATIGSASITSETVGTATITNLLVLGTASFASDVTIQGVAGTQAALTVLGTGTSTAVGTGLAVSVNGTLVFQVTGGTNTTGAPTALVVQGYGPAAAGLVDLTPDRAYYVGTLSGVSPNQFATATVVRVGHLVTIQIPALLGTGTVGNISTCAINVPMAAEFQSAATISQFLWVAASGTLAVGGVQYSGTAFSLTPTTLLGTFTGLGLRGVDQTIVMNWTV
jgi:hypothetical protein